MPPADTYGYILAPLNIFEQLGTLGQLGKTLARFPLILKSRTTKN